MKISNFGEPEGMVPLAPLLSVLSLGPRWFGLSLLSQSNLLFLAVSLSETLSPWHISRLLHVCFCPLPPFLSPSSTPLG